MAGDHWDEFHYGYTKFRELTKSAANKNTVLRYFKFLEIDEKDLRSLDGLTEKESTQAKLKWLCGPHAETFYKIWKIRNDT